MKCDMCHKSKPVKDGSFLNRALGRAVFKPYTAICYDCFELELRRKAEKK